MTVSSATGTLPQRVLGKTGEKVPILGLGTAPGGMGMDDAAAIELFEMAIDAGVTYLDTAPDTSGHRRNWPMCYHADETRSSWLPRS